MPNNSNLGNYYEFMKSSHNVFGDQQLDRSKCVHVCTKYLTGVWQTVSAEDIDIRRLSGGLGSTLHVCKTRNNSSDSEGQQEVVVRFYGVSTGLSTNRADVGICAAILSQIGVGPKVFGVFEHGQVMRYHESRNFTEQDLFDPDMRDELAGKLALLHCSQPPIEKTNYTFRLYNYYLAKIDGQFEQDLSDKCNKYGCEALLALDLKKEMEWLLKNVNSFGSPVVFSHVDCRFGNTIVTEDKEVFLCDFDFCAYNYRGFDFAFLFSNFTDPDVNEFKLKDKTVVTKFIESYLDKCQQVVGKHFLRDTANSVEHILEEMRRLSMVFCHFWIIVNVFEEITRYVALDESILLHLADSMAAKYRARKLRHLANK